MSLPECYVDVDHYLNDVVEFLRDHQWIYNYPNTHVLVENVFEKIPEDWKTSLHNLKNEELRNLPFGYVNESWPISMKEFFGQMRKMKPLSRHIEVEKCNLKIKGLSLKKQHEIAGLAPLVDKHCKENGINVIVDIGCGLGYLPQFLNSNYGYKVLGIEADVAKVNKAIERQSKYFDESVSSVRYVQHYVTDSSPLDRYIGDFLREIDQSRNTTNGRVCLTGLHACADLSITVINLLNKFPVVHSAVIMACCYHRMKSVVEDDKEVFANFPKSASLGTICDRNDGTKFLKTPFLRLACQNSVLDWKYMSENDHTVHSVGMMRRAVLQKVVEEGGHHLARKKRKGKILPLQLQNDHFTTYLDGLAESHKVTDKMAAETAGKMAVDNLINRCDFRTKMQDTWDVCKEDCFLLEVLSGLQVCLQPICENLVLLDRVVAAEETDGVRCVTEQGVGGGEKSGT